MNTTNYSGETIIMFHIGRGGRFYNSGSLSFAGTKKITDCEEYNLIYPPKYKNGTYNLRTLSAEWTDCNGNTIGLTNEMVKSGVGRIELDGDYDTTYTTRLRDLQENEIKAIREAKPWNIEYIEGVIAALELE
jgi:hypothetical protein